MGLQPMPPESSILLSATRWVCNFNMPIRTEVRCGLDAAVPVEQRLADIERQGQAPGVQR